MADAVDAYRAAQETEQMAYNGVARLPMAQGKSQNI